MHKFKSKKALTSLMLGIFSTAFSFFFLFIIVAIIGLIVGIIALKEIKKFKQEGRKIAITSIIFNILGIVLPIIFIIITYSYDLSIFIRNLNN